MANMNKNGGAEETKKISTIPKSIGVHRQASIKEVQNVLLVWLDSKSKNNDEDNQNTITQLRCVINDINIFTHGEECIQFIKDINDNKICMIVSGSLGQHIVPRVHNMSQVDSIFIFCGNQKYHEEWSKEWPKIKGVFTKIGPICEALKQVSQHCEQNAISISFVATNEGEVNQNLDRLDPMFMYTQIMKEILLTIDFEPQHFKEFIDYCREIFVENEGEWKNIDKFEREYCNETPIWWYTYECFLYPMLNRALRTNDVDIMIKMGFFIRNLHCQIEALYKKQLDDYQAGTILKVYCGQGLSKSDFEKMKKTKGGLISFNNFLSTSKNRNVSLPFAHNALTDPDSVGILFVMTIDPSKSTTPFASIIDVSYYKDKEDEVLFSMHTVFRIHDIQSISGNQRLIQVNLTLTDENDDKDLRELTDRIREASFPNSRGWYRLGSMLYKMGKFKEAEQVYQVLLDQAITDLQQAPIYNQLGLAKAGQERYREAIAYYEKAVKLYIKTCLSNHPDLASCYNNNGMAYEKMGEYLKALSYYNKALKIKQQSLPVNHSSLAASYCNIGNVCYHTDEYSKALSFHEKALEIYKKSLPLNHPDLAMSHYNIGKAYEKMNEYSKARSFYEYAVNIAQLSLPPNHPHLQLYKNDLDEIKKTL